MSVSNINYKGIAHTPSLVSDKDGAAAECVNLAPDNGDLKPMPMPVKKSDTYTVLEDHKIVFVHTGNGYENIVELRDDRTRIAIRDSETGLSLLGSYWYFTNGSEIVAVQSIGDTLVVSTKAGTEYLVYKNEPPQGITAPGYYRILGQKPPMPSIEFMMHEDTSVMREVRSDFPTGDESYEIVTYDNAFWFKREAKEPIVDSMKALVASLENRMSQDAKFHKPFYIRYAMRMKTGDHIMHSPAVLMLPSGLVCPFSLQLLGSNYVTGARAAVQPSSLTYKVTNASDFSDWSDIIDRIDIAVTPQIDNYDYDTMSGGEEDNTKVRLASSTTQSPYDYGTRYVDGEIKQWEQYTVSNEYVFVPKDYDARQVERKITEASVFRIISSLSLDEVSSQMQDYEELPIDDLGNIDTLPVMQDDYDTHNAISPSLMQTYNTRLNMANVMQKVFEGFPNAMQPQSSLGYYPFNETVEGVIKNYNVYVLGMYYKVKKDGKTYTVENPDDGAMLDYCTYLYYPDGDCSEAVVAFRTGSDQTVKYCTIRMKRHDSLNGSYWYNGMECLGHHVGYKHAIGESSTSEPQVSEDLWYGLHNRFMMSSVGNPWHFPVDGMFDIGRGDIRAMSVNAENMDAPQFGQNPIYVFSSDGTYAVNINADGTYNKLSYVSGDVVAEPQGLGTSPTASAEQLTFFKTERGILAMSGSSIKEIDLCMKGMVFNPKLRLLTAGSVFDGLANESGMGAMTDLIENACDNYTYTEFVRGCSLAYDYRNKRLILFNGDFKYMYVYDVRYDFWSKMYPTTAVDGDTPVVPSDPPTRDDSVQTYTVFSSVAMSGLSPVLQDSEGSLWSAGGVRDENEVTERKLGFYVSKPMRWGTDGYKTLEQVVHYTQLNGSDKVRMALYGSRDGRNYYRVGKLKGTSYKFFVIVLYMSILPSSRYAYTAFQWNERLSKNKIR